jgi:ribosomal biogenesis protein LAS1
MAWLLHNYFLPTLNSSAAAAPTAPNLRPLEPLLKEYKALLKITTRDASLKKQYAAQITTVLRDVERWVAEAKVAAGRAVGLGWEIDGNIQERGSETAKNETVGDERERWALERLAEALLERGALIPLSKK